MKKYWSASRAVLTLGIVLAAALIPPCFESLQHIDGTALLLGLPFSFLTIRSPLAGIFAVHLNLASLVGDLLAVYFVLYGVSKLPGRFHRS